MRYRPFGASGSTVSTLTLSVGLDALAAGPDAAEEPDLFGAGNRHQQLPAGDAPTRSWPRSWARR